MTNPEIRAWLQSSGKDRHWLAEQIGCTYGTLTQWFSKGFPEWAVKSIERLANPPKNPGSSLELTFTDSEFDEIIEAMKLSGYTQRRDFYHDAITEKAAQVMASAAGSKIIAHPAATMGQPSRAAEDPGQYGAQG